jgi:sugar transferase (PEP-CTERM/EpsH1 system associated)
MRVLFATNRCPGALTRGDQLRAFQHIRHLSARHAITLLCFDAGVPSDALDALRACCERVILAPRSRIGMAVRALSALPGARPLQVAMHDAVPRAADLPGLLATSDFDLAHLQLVRLGGLVPRLAPLPVVVDLVDALSLNMARRAATDRGPMRAIARMEARRLAQYERTLCSRVAAATVCAAADRDAIGDIANLHLVGNGVDLQAFPFARPQASNSDIVFVGNLGYFPNVDAATWFANAVFARVRAQDPHARLRLVGARPAPALRQLATRIDGVELVGEVDHVLPHLQRAAVAVVPLRAGSGQQLKLLEAMAAGTPVVATSQSAAGLDAIDGEHLLIADDFATMADAVLRLLGDQLLARRLALAARALVERRWSWERSALDLEAVWIRAVGHATG